MKRLFFISSMIVGVVFWHGEVLADHYKVGNPPTMKVLHHNGVALEGNSTLTVLQGDHVTLTAESEDTDLKETMTEGGKSDVSIADGASVIWSATGNAQITGQARKRSGDPATITCPNVPAGQTSITVTVTAQAEDVWENDTGGLAGGDTGKRNDEPGGSLTINIVVIKSGPTSIEKVQQYTGPNTSLSVYFSTAPYNQVFTLGDSVSQMKVTGGTPPTPPGNWNGLVIHESIVIHPTDPGSLELVSKLHCCKLAPSWEL